MMDGGRYSERWGRVFRTLTSFVRLIVIRIKNHRVLKQCQCLSDKYYKVDECYWNLVREAEVRKYGHFW
jgi:hypothetical protein